MGLEVAARNALALMARRASAGGLIISLNFRASGLSETCSRISSQKTSQSRASPIVRPAWRSCVLEQARRMLTRDAAKKAGAPIECGEPRSAPDGRLPDLLREPLVDSRAGDRAFPRRSRRRASDRRIVGLEAHRRRLAGLWRQTFLEPKASRRLALDLDIERNGRIQLQRQSIKRHWRSFAQLELQFTNVLLRLSRNDRPQIERRLDDVAIDFQ